jgi:hypothetical protein
MSVHRLVYASRNLVHIAHVRPLDAIRDILTISEINNRRDGITGSLVFDSDHFIQILEGPRQAVFAAFRRIQDDPRHTDIDLIEFAEAPFRLFGDWTMAGSLRLPKHDEIFRRYGISGPVAPAALKAKNVVSLALDLVGAR